MTKEQEDIKQYFERKVRDERNSSWRIWKN